MNEIHLAERPFMAFTPADFAMYHVEQFGGIDGAHHKAWVLDQVARALKGVPVTITKREWTDHEPEYDIDQGTNTAYEQWVLEMRGEYDEESESYEYDYDEGIAP